MSTRFTEEAKKKFVAQLENKSALAVAREHNFNPSQASILRWSKQFKAPKKGELRMVNMNPEKYNKADRFNFVIHTLGMSLKDLEVQAKEKGITLDVVDSWRAEYLFSMLRPVSNSSTEALQEENEALKRRLHALEEKIQKVLEL